MKKTIKIIIILLLVLGLFIIFYLNSYYKADKMINDYLKSNDVVKVKNIDNGYYFDGPGKDELVIFYPGAKVESISYSPLLYNLAKEGADSFLVNMPFNIAFFDNKAALKIIDDYKYDSYYLMGHSLGGVVISNYSDDSNVEGLILLASYPTKRINTKLLSIYGDKDGVLDKKEYEKSKKYFPKDYKEIVIKNGNHAKFGNYGEQKKDNYTKLSNNKQQEQTIKAIMEFIKES